MGSQSTNETDALPPWLAEPYRLCELCVPGEIAGEQVDIEDSLLRVAAAELAAEHDVPRIAHSQCRGFALRSTDTLAASFAEPTVLAVRSALRLPRSGIASVPRLQAGAAEAILIPGGMPMPEGADAISPAPPRYVDDIDSTRGDKWTLRLTAPVGVGNGVLQAGSDCMRGDVLLAPGERIAPSAQALCAAAGVSQLLVTRRPRIGVVVASHDIVAPANSASEIWQRPDSTGIFVRSLLRRWGYDVGPVGYLSSIAAKSSSASEPTSRDAYIAATRELISSCDLIIACGTPADPIFSSEGFGDPIGFPFGRTRIDIPQVPAGRLNFARSEDRSAPRVWQRTVIRPGALLPSTIRVESHDQAVLVNLPGHTATVGILMHCIVRRIIDLLEGVTDLQHHWEWATLEHSISSDSSSNRMLWGVAPSSAREPASVRVTVKPEPDLISAMCAANALVALCASDKGLRAGDHVRILRL